jgi:hypothetical protein
LTNKENKERQQRNPNEGDNKKNKRCSFVNVFIDPSEKTNKFVEKGFNYKEYKDDSVRYTFSFLL